MSAGIQYTMIVPEYFFAGIAADLAEFFIRVGDIPLHIGVGDDDGLIDRILFFDQFLMRLR